MSTSVDLANDLNRMVTVYSISQMAAGKSLKDTTYQIDLLNDLLAVMFYQQVAQKLDLSLLGRYESLGKDLFKSLFLVLAANYQSKTLAELTSRQFLIRLAYMMVAICVYHLAVKPLLIDQLKTQLPNWVLPGCLEDWTETLTVLTLNNQTTNRADWLQQVRNKMLAIAIYHYVVKPC